MVPSAIASEMTTVIRDFGTGVETRRARIAREIQVPANQVLGLIAFAHRLSSSLLDFEGKRDYAIVDRHLTRC